MVQNYIERLANLLRNEARRSGVHYGLQPVQLEALNYLAACNRYSNTPLGVTDYLGLTKGTVSQTLKVLEAKGLIDKHIDAKDKRVVHLHLTNAGNKLLQDAVPAPVLSKAYQILPGAVQQQLGAGLAELLRSLQQTNGLKSFGVCTTCRYNRRLSDDTFFCELTNENLSRRDTELICREHAAKSESS